MSIITLKELENHRQKLSDDFDELKKNIGKVEVDLGAMKSNLNALNGAIQFASNLIMIADKKGESHRISSDEPEVSPIKKKVKKKKDEKI
tara:strand:- start:79 stop:348 length:270 start_codon:yes stop_codon:yes gene_type:complete